MWLQVQEYFTNAEKKDNLIVENLLSDYVLNISAKR